MALLCLAGCAVVPPMDSEESFLQEQLAASEQAAAQNNPRGALAYLYPLLTLNPEDDEELKARIATLEAEVDARVSRAMSRGKAAYERGDRRAGDASMLQALALEPGLEEALLALRLSASEVSHGRQAEKVAYEFTQREEAEEQQALAMLEQALSEEKYEQVLEMGEAQDLEAEGAVQDMTLQAHVGLAARARSAGDQDAELRHIGAAVALSGGEDRKLLAREKTLRDALSDSAYREGLALMQTDLAGAIAQFERAVAYAPGNLAAKQKLDQARTLKKNLDRIRGG
jgi:cation transport regulator ChaC